MASGHKQVIVGNFFENVCHSIFGGELSRNEDGDICLWRSETTIEVKSSGFQSSYGFRCDIKQIRDYESMVNSNFPFSSGYYATFAYSNPSTRQPNGRRKSALAPLTTITSIHPYLAQKVLWCVVVDLSIVTRWKDRLPHARKSLLGHKGVPTVDLKACEISEYANGGLVSRLRELGLCPADYVRISGRASVQVRPNLFDSYRVKFPLTAIVHKYAVANFQRRLRRRGIRLKQNSYPA